jgi:hypothetical protein
MMLKTMIKVTMRYAGQRSVVAMAGFASTAQRSFKERSGLSLPLATTAQWIVAAVAPRITYVMQMITRMGMVVFL